MHTLYHEVMHMSRRCRYTIYGILACLGICVIGVLVKILFFSGLFVPLLKVDGDKEMKVQVHESFRDPGVIASYRFHDYSDEVKRTSNLNTDKLGTYTIVYHLDSYDKKVSRTVHVVDTKAPTITLKQGKMIRVFENGTYQEPGFHAQDNYDGDLTKKVMVKHHVNMKKTGTYDIVYQVKDASNNIASVTRKVQVCKDPTTTKLYYNHDDYDNTAEEWWFNKSKEHKRTTGAKPQSLLDKYDAYYQGKDEKVIYLTFDEGGNDITYIKQIADVLNKNDVKATFFLTRNYIKNEADFMRNLVKHGHVIGNHTWHHYDMTTLANAKDVDAFVKEITETEKTYMEVCGVPMKKVFRFPKGGGSERAMKMVKDLGYRTYFWSHAYYDYASDVSGEEALKTMMDHYHNGAIYLLHPSNKGNYEAMDTFIKNMKKEGYRFATVDEIK